MLHYTTQRFRIEPKYIYFKSVDLDNDNKLDIELTK